MVDSPVLERHPDDGWTLAVPRSVSDRTHRVLRALGDAILPDSPRVSTTLEDAIHHTLISLQYMPRSSARLFLLSMRLLNWYPLWALRGLRPLTSLPSEAVRDHLRAATRSRWLPVRILLYAPLGLFMSFYFDQDYVHREIDYAPTPFVAERIRARRMWLEGQEP